MLRKEVNYVWESIKYYTGFSDKHHRYNYMDPLAITGILAFLLHLISGWTLYVFSNFQGIRTAYHFCMWLLLGWALIHIYFQVWKSIRLKQYDISAIVGGYKFIEVRK